MGGSHLAPTTSAATATRRGPAHTCDRSALASGHSSTSAKAPPSTMKSCGWRSRHCFTKRPPERAFRCRANRQRDAVRCVPGSTARLRSRTADRAQPSRRSRGSTPGQTAAISTGAPPRRRISPTAGTSGSVRRPVETMTPSRTSSYEQTTDPRSCTGRAYSRGCSAAPSPERRSAACHTGGLAVAEARAAAVWAPVLAVREISSAHGQCSRRSRRVLRPLRRAAKRCRSGSANPRRV